VDCLNKKVIVVGGGIVGSVQALLLARVGFRVLLVDASMDSPERYGEGARNSLSVRTVAMSYRSQQLLQSAGMWTAGLGCPIHTVMVNDKGRFGSVRFDRRDYAVPVLGYVVRNQLLENHLNGLLDTSPLIEVVRPATAALAAIDEKRVEVVVDQAGAKRAEVGGLIVAADGTRSGVRTQLGIDVDNTDYQQYALVANLQCQKPHHHIAYERFTESGPLALLPLDDRVVSMICTIGAEEVESLQQCTDEALLVLLQQRFGGRLGRFQEIGKRVVFPLSLVRARQQVSRCGVLVGNASVTVHPVAGQGLNLALRDVFELAARLGEHDEPVAQVLSGFAQSRRADQQFVVRQTDWLARWFRAQRGPLAPALNATRVSSMLMLDLVPALRNRFGRRNTGLDIPLKPVTDGS
jgi:2-octaprenyl-6-methoxyphenol hydroxylase